MEKICGIYKITNNINGKKYIGQSVNIYDRWMKEKAPSAKKYALQKAFDKYGQENFTFEIIERLQPEELNEREIYWIAYYDTYYNGYNETLGGDSGQLYDYQQIYNLWCEGYTCKQIEEKIGCKDEVITRALRCYNVSENEARSKNNTNPAVKIVMIDVNTNESLKIFKSRFEVCDFLNITPAQTEQIRKAIHNNKISFGYKWEILNESNIPIKNYSNEEILQKQDKHKVLSETHKINLSLSQRTVTRPNRKTLKDLIRTTSFVEIGRMYGNVSDNAVRRWCDFYGLPRKKNVIKSYSDEEWKKI